MNSSRNPTLLGSRALIAALWLPALCAAQGQIPLPIPPIAPAPAGNPVTAAKVNLGKVLFWEEQLSSNQTVACGTCHVFGAGGSDPRSGLLGAQSANPGADDLFGTADDVLGSLGVTRARADGSLELAGLFRLQRQVTPRRSMSAINSGYLQRQFWNGRAEGAFKDPITGAIVLAQGASLEIQSLEPPTSVAEMAHIGRDWNDVAERIASATPLRLASDIPVALANWINGRTYRALFQEAFGTSDVTPLRIAMAIASYERTLVSNQSPFDAFMGGNSNALTPLEQQGLQVFNGAGRCNVCHSGPLQTDGVFHYTGVRPQAEDLGRGQVTGLVTDLGAMKTPSLRNVELRAPYFHNGQMATLSDVIDFYDRGGDFSAANKPPTIAPIGFTPQQKAALLALLTRPMTDPRVAAETAPFDRPVLYSETQAVPAHYGAASSGAGGFAPQLVAFEPAILGDRKWTVGIDGGHAGREAVLLLSPIQVLVGLPFQGATLHVGLGAGAQVVRIGALQGNGAGLGFGSATLEIPGQAQLAGQIFYAQWLVFDPQGGGRRLSSSDAVAVTYL